MSNIRYEVRYKLAYEIKKRKRIEEKLKHFTPYIKKSVKIK